MTQVFLFIPLLVWGEGQRYNKGNQISSLIVVTWRLRARKDKALSGKARKYLRNWFEESRWIAVMTCMLKRYSYKFNLKLKNFFIINHNYQPKWIKLGNFYLKKNRNTRGLRGKSSKNWRMSWNMTSLTQHKYTVR